MRLCEVGGWEGGKDDGNLGIGKTSQRSRGGCRAGIRVGKTGVVGGCLAPGVVCMLIGCGRCPSCRFGVVVALLSRVLAGADS